MLFARSLASHLFSWLKSPVGSRLADASLPAGSPLAPLPKRSRLFTAAILAATVVLLSLPQSREAVSAIRAGWNGFNESPADRRALEKLAARAEKQKDARTLAFVALSLPEPHRAASFADRAVALDPSLVWIYSSRFRRPEDSLRPKEQLERLHAADPDNAFPDLLVADAIAYPRYQALLEHHSATEAEIETALTAEPEWVALMERAFHAPRYDSYFRRDLDLGREVWNRDRFVSPSTMAYSLWSHAIPNLLYLKLFARFQVHRAQAANASGRPEQAESILREADSFGKRMSDQAETDIERVVSLDVSREALRELQAMNIRAGRSSEARQVAARLLQVEERERSLQSAFGAAQDTSLRWKGVVVQMFAVLMVLCAFLAAAALLALEVLRRRFSRRGAAWQRISCIAADYAPAALLAASLAFLISFLPFARRFAEYRSTDSPVRSFGALTGAVWGLSRVPALLRPSPDSVAFWYLVTAALAALAIFILLRGLLRPRRQTL